ncbi:hypothetical protein [Nocardia sp. R7R-8]|uniref:hypothetical protein n=1 Tax=Nocardia sp. R7R-8 TaxID=3459304 RepID=UPI00403DC9CE
MAIQVVRGALMTSDYTDHQARSVGQGAWVVSSMPGRTFDLEQAVAAMRIAELTGEARELADLLKVPLLEAVGRAMVASPWRAGRRPRRFPLDLFGANPIGGATR